MNVLLTGGGGFLGNAVLLRLLARDGVKVTATSFRRRLFWEHDRLTEFPDCDLKRHEDVDRLFRKCEPDIIFHLAGVALNSMADPLMTENNVLATHRLLHRCPDDCRFVYVSSAVVYGNGCPDGGFRETDPAAPVSVYAAGKVAAEGLVSAYAAKDGMFKLSSSLIVRPAALVGRGATHGLLPDVVNKLRSLSPDLELYGDWPGACKPFTHVDDVAAGIVELGMSHKSRGVVNIANADALSVAQVAGLAMDRLGVRKPISWRPDRVWRGDNPLVMMNNTRAGGLGWKPRFPTSAAAVNAALDEYLGVK